MTFMDGLIRATTQTSDEVIRFGKRIAVLINCVQDLTLRAPSPRVALE